MPLATRRKRKPARQRCTRNFPSRRNCKQRHNFRADLPGDAACMWSEPLPLAWNNLICLKGTTCSESCDQEFLMILETRLDSNPRRRDRAVASGLLRFGSSFWPRTSALIVREPKSPLNRKFELVFQAPESWLIAYSIVTGEHHCRSQERIVFSQSCL